METFLLKNYDKLLTRKNFNPRFILMEWSYFKGGNIWIPFDIELSYDVESNYISGNLSFSLNSNNTLLHFDLEKCVFFDNKTVKPREIQRDKLFGVFHKVISSHFSPNPAEKIGKSAIWTTISDKNAVSGENCSLCLESLNSSNLFGQFKECKGHYFHFKCDKNMRIFDYVNQTGVCPVCRKKYIDNVAGSCPDGTMLVRKVASRLAGIDHFGVWEVLFDFPPGVQTTRHQHPGRTYPRDKRWAYLPDSVKGAEVLTLFIKAWAKRVLFTVGYSVTRGVDDVIVYNGVHMKTSIRGSYGYPDAGYLERVTGELRLKGIE